MLCRYIKLSLILIIMALCYNTVSSSEATASTLEDEYRINNPLHVVAGPEEAKDVRRVSGTQHTKSLATLCVRLMLQGAFTPEVQIFILSHAFSNSHLYALSMNILDIAPFTISSFRMTTWNSQNDWHPSQRLQTVNEEAFGQVLVDVPADPTTGPWPECLGMNSDDCIQFIESKAQDIYTVVVLPIETERTRVWVSVDDNGKVNKVPYRGWIKKSRRETKNGNKAVVEL
jgi:hypothetical protein